MPESLLRHSVIDADVHSVVPSVETLFPYLTAYWREYISQSAFKGPVENPYPPKAPTSVRPDLRDAVGSAAGTTVKHLRDHVLDPLDVEVAILNCVYGVESVHNPDAAAALASAVNDWHLAEWLEPEPRLRASIVVPSQQPAMAAAEIDRVGDNPRFVQVLLLARTREPLGKRRFWKIYEAAVRHDLPVGIHFGGTGGVPFTGAGWPSFYLEDHGGMPQAFQAHLISLVCEGVFARFPTLKVVFIESGFAWLPSLLWRLDNAWEKLRDDVPHFQTRPSVSVREHLWLTTQPMDEPSQPAFFLELLDQMQMNDRLMFATDYPHWDFDAPDRAFPVRLPNDLKDQILRDNAYALYRLT